MKNISFIFIFAGILTGCTTGDQTISDTVGASNNINVVTAADAMLNAVATVEAAANVAEQFEQTSTTKKFSTVELNGIDSHFNFNTRIPADWAVEYMADIQAINFYDPQSSGATPLEQSQIFVRYFTASEFLTLQTVTIHSETATTINNRPAVLYDIEKNAGVADFTSQPSWRNTRHMVTDIRSTDDSPTTFYVFGKRPDLQQEIFDEFIDSVEFN